MSGGHFDYNQHRINDISDSIEQLIIDNNIPDEFGYTHSFSPEIIKQFTKAKKILDIAAIYAHRIDWLVCGDDGEESFFKRLEEDLNALRDV